MRGILSSLSWRHLPWLILVIQASYLLYKWEYRTPLIKSPVKSIKETQEEQDIEEYTTHLTDADKGAFMDVGIPPSKSTKRIFYNRVPKCGSSALLDTFETLSQMNNFTFIRTSNYMTFRVDIPHQKAFIRDFLSIPGPMLFERHMHHVNFPKVSDQPVYINIIREPLERMISWYYFRRYQDGHVRDMPTEKRVRTFDECVFTNQSECVEPMGYHSEEGYFKLIPFFCGQDDFCKEPTDRALIQAVHHVKQFYAVVGIVEEHERFVSALEFLLPQYFKGAVRVFKDLQGWNQRFRTTYKLPPSKEAIKIMQSKLHKEYQFYLFVRHRFHRLMERIENIKERNGKVRI